MKSFLLFTASICLLSFFACEETTEVFNPNSDTEYKKQQFSTLAGQFDYIWTGLNNSYVFWYAETTDWDSVREHYMPEFEALDELGKKGVEIKGEMIDSLLTEIAVPLRDRHLVLYMSNPYSDKPSPISSMSGQTALLTRDDVWLLLLGHSFCNLNLLLNYKYSDLKQMSYSVGGFSQIVYSCIINDSIPFLHMPNYKVTDETFCRNNKEYLPVVNNFFDNIRALSSQDRLKGIIIDNRINTGGNATDIDLFVQTFSSKPLEISRQRTKYGLGKRDYTPWNTYKIYPYKSKYIDIHDAPIVILQDYYSMSAGELLGHALSFLPNTHIIGNRSYGAHSPISGDDTFNNTFTGSFNHDSIDYYIDHYGAGAAVITATFCEEMKNKRTGEFEQLEGIGISPDEYVQLNDSLLKLGKGDNQLDAALRYIREY